MLEHGHEPQSHNGFTGVRTNSVEVSWRKSSYSGATSNSGVVGLSESSGGVRATKDPESAILEFSADRWKDFLRALR
ncbi:MAG: DUF397 domain-containing protein [Saccharopolyspora rectivirgula]